MHQLLSVAIFSVQVFVVLEVMNNGNSKSPDLEQLSSMLSEGVISQEEYDRAVSLIAEKEQGVGASMELSSMTPPSARLKESEQSGAVKGMSSMRFDIEHVNEGNVAALSEVGYASKLRKFSVTSASVVGVMFVTLSIGFTNLDPTVAMRKDVETSEKMSSMGLKTQMHVPLVKKSSIREERLPYNAYIEPVFGPDAMARCVHTCEADEGAACADSCKKHSTKSYVESAMSKNLEPASVLEEVKQSCLASTPRFESNRTRLAWGSNVKATMRALREYPRMMQGVKWGEAKLRYNRLNQLNRRLALPWGADDEQKKLVALLSETTCVRMHLANVEMELIRTMGTMENSGKEDYLNGLRDSIKGHSVTREVDLLKQVHSMRESAKSKS